MSRRERIAALVGLFSVLVIWVIVGIALQGSTLVEPSSLPTAAVLPSAVPEQPTEPAPAPFPSFPQMHPPKRHPHQRLFRLRKRWHPLQWSCPCRICLQRRFQRRNPRL